MAIPITYVHAGIGVLLAVLSLPLILGKVPMNRGYGIRIRKAYVSDSNWLAINRFGGVVMMILGLLLVVFSYVTATIAPSPRSILAPLYLVAPLLVGIVVGTIAVGFYSGTLPDK